MSQTDFADQQRRVAAVVAALGLSANDSASFVTWPTLQPALEPVPYRLSTAQLAELLKHPMCVGAARRAVLDQLGNRYHRTFADVWEFVRYAEEQKLGLDFIKPPQRPEVVATTPPKP